MGTPHRAAGDHTFGKVFYQVGRRVSQVEKRERKDYAVGALVSQVCMVPFSSLKESWHTPCTAYAMQGTQLWTDLSCQLSITAHHKSLQNAVCKLITEGVEKVKMDVSQVLCCKPYGDSMGLGSME